MAKKSFADSIIRYLPYLSLLAFFLFWQAIVDFGIIPRTMLASPTEVIKMFFFKLTNIDPDGSLLYKHVLVSLEEALLGYILALLVGIPLGLAMGWFGIFEGLTKPIFEMIRPIPSVAWIPLVIFWFGTGLISKVYIIFIGALVPCVINSYTGVRMTNPTFIRMGRTYGASNWKIFTKICIPSALPMVFGGLQVALAVAWTCLVAAELVGADVGLGFLITMGRRLLKPDLILLGMAMVGLTGVLISAIVDRIEKRLVSGLRR